MSVKGKGNGDYDFSRAAYDEQRDSEVSYCVLWSTSLRTAYQKGVWELVTFVVPTTGEGVGKTVVSLTSHWPNSMAATWASHFYQHNHKVSRMVEAWALDRQKSEAR